jgi:hypothetical protein
MGYHHLHTQLLKGYSTGQDLSNEPKNGKIGSFEAEKCGDHENAIK